MLRPMAARAKMMASSSTAARRAFSRISPQSIEPPSSDPFGPPEDALRPHEQDHDEHGQRPDVLQLERDPERRHLDQQPDQETAEQGAVGRAETAEGDAGEHEEEQLEPEAEAHLLIGREQDPSE